MSNLVNKTIKERYRAYDFIVRSAYRAQDEASTANNGLGFRCATDVSIRIGQYRFE